jgi:hypothetical protein
MKLPLPLRNFTNSLLSDEKLQMYPRTYGKRLHMVYLGRRRRVVLIVRLRPHGRPAELGFSRQWGEKRQGMAGWVRWEEGGWREKEWYWGVGLFVYFIERERAEGMEASRPSRRACERASADQAGWRLTQAREPTVPRILCAAAPPAGSRVSPLLLHGLSIGNRTQWPLGS